MKHVIPFRLVNIRVTVWEQSFPGGEGETWETNRFVISGIYIQHGKFQPDLKGGGKGGEVEI